jgi:hypothetical protein
MTIAAGSRILGEASPVFAFGWERGRAKKKMCWNALGRHGGL